MFAGSWWATKAEKRWQLLRALSLGITAGITMSGLTPVHAQVGTAGAPVINLKKERVVRPEGQRPELTMPGIQTNLNRQELPPVISRKPSGVRPESNGVNARISSRLSVSSWDAGETLQQVQQPPVLAPVVRGRPPAVQGLNEATKSSVTSEKVPSELERPARQKETRDRTAMRIPTSISNPEIVAPSKFAGVWEQKFAYGETGGLSEPVTIDMRDDSRVTTAKGRVAPKAGIPLPLNADLFDPTHHAPTPKQLITFEGSPREPALLEPQSENPAVRPVPSLEMSKLENEKQFIGNQDPTQPSTSPSDVQSRPEASPKAPVLERLPSPKSVEPEFADESFRPIQQVGVNIAPGQGLLPPNRAAQRFAREGEEMQPTGYSREEMETQVEWDAPAVCHRPLFFEDVNLERHGYHVKHIQPFVSAAHFFSRVPATPYLAVSQRSRLCNYTLGHYQPGSHAPYVWYYPRPSLTGAALEGALVTGLILALP